MAGDIFLLGSTSWRIRRVESGRGAGRGRARAPPTMPFWHGEGPARTARAVARRSPRCARIAAGAATSPSRALRAGSADECELERGGAEQACDYVVEGARRSARVPTQHTRRRRALLRRSAAACSSSSTRRSARASTAPGAWRCARSSAAPSTSSCRRRRPTTAILLSIGPQHSFPLDAIFGFLTPPRVEETLVQAALQSPMWETRWRWNATRALAVLRFTGRQAHAAAALAHARGRPAWPRCSPRRPAARTTTAAMREDIGAARSSAGERDDARLPAGGDGRRGAEALLSACAPARSSRWRASVVPWAHASELHAVHLPRRRAARGAPLARGRGAPRAARGIVEGRIGGLDPER